MRTIADLTYATVDGAELKLDLHLPDDQAGVPVVVYTHGGAFMVGDRKANAQARLGPVVERGLAVASVQYRFTDVACYPAQLHDVKAAVRWVRAHGGEYGYAADRVGSWGASAGGYLALMLALTSGDESLESSVGDHPGVDSSVQATVPWFALTDLVKADAAVKPHDREMPSFASGPRPVPSGISRLIGVDDAGRHPEEARAASPVSFAGRAKGSYFLMHGDRDAMVHEEQSIAMHEALVAAGADSTLMLLGGLNHEDPGFHRPAVLGAVADFFLDRLAS